MIEAGLNNVLQCVANKKPFALLHRPHAIGAENMEIITGKINPTDSINGIPLIKKPLGQALSSLILIPYRQLRERGFAHINDNSPLIVMDIESYDITSVQDLLKMISHLPVDLINGHFDIDDQAYAAIARRVIEEEIGAGEGSNFVIKRQFMAEITDYTVYTSLSIFRSLLQNETGAYWTFLIHTGDRTFIGASPEMHVSLKNNIAMMNPISGTYRYPASGPTIEGLMNFLSTSKEIDELYMVVEEELKMISRFCPEGGKVVGPFLKEMSRLAHTEYFIQGETTCDPRMVLTETMFAPTVTGSPIENACRVIVKYEPKGRAYYAGVAAVMGYDESGNSHLDSAILIRTADISNQGKVCIGVGSTIVRHSDPLAEAAETHAKAMALLAAMNVKRETSCV